MAEINVLPQVDEKTKIHRTFAWMTLLPFPIWLLLGALILAGFAAMLNASPGSGDALGWILIAVAAIYFPPYIGLLFAALIGVILSFTVWRKSRTRFLTILLWIDVVLLGLHVVLLLANFVYGKIYNMRGF